MDNRSDPRTDPRTDEEIVAAVNGGDLAAFEVLVERYSGRLYRLAWSFVKEDHTAQDVTQEAFLNAYRGLARFEGKSAFGSWIYRITVNAALMKLRSKRRRPEESLEAKSEGFGGGPRESHLVLDRQTAATEFASTELRSEIQTAVDGLEEKYRAVFLLRDVDGLSIAETAEVLELSAAAVKSRLHRARLFLRASLERYVKDA